MSYGAYYTIFLPLQEAAFPLGGSSAAVAVAETRTRWYNTRFMKTRQFWYPLPERLIAQHPAERRGTEKMMVLHRDTGVIEHRHIADIVDYITANDLLVVNDTKVFPARLLGEWPDTHGAVEILLVNAAPMDADDARPLMDLLDEFGHTPVPPYVKREGTAEEEREDRERYQTIYAREVGSVAAPTAGLHFTPEIFAALETKGVRRVSVTLHVGPGTFRPVKADDIEDHQMDFEAFTVPSETAAAINACKARGGRVFCVGSTTVRTLETVAAATEDGRVVAGSGASNIFIHPPYRFRVCDCMLTNFHLPQSTLLMMVSALAGRERILCAYALAVRANYMFFSYGDCMLIV